MVNKRTNFDNESMAPANHQMPLHLIKLHRNVSIMGSTRRNVKTGMAVMPETDYRSAVYVAIVAVSTNQSTARRRCRLDLGQLLIANATGTSMTTETLHTIIS